MEILVCIECQGRKACTLFYPGEERTIRPVLCGPDPEGVMKKPVWEKAPEDYIKKVFR
jgi:hypothetical protein